MALINRYVVVGAATVIAATAAGWSVHLVTMSPGVIRTASAVPSATAPGPSADSGYGAAGGYGGAAATAGSGQPSVPSLSSGGDAGGTGKAATTRGDVTAGLVARTVPDLGVVVTDSSGFVLYRFDKDVSDPPTSACTAACASTWLPVLTTGSGPALQGIDPTLVGSLRRVDGIHQLTIGGWPLYRYSGDPKAGAWKGQGSGGAWWAVAPNGKKIVRAPKPAPTGATPTRQAPPPNTASPTPTSGGYGSGAPKHW